MGEIVMKRKKVKMKRLSVSLPTDMMEDICDQADIAGISRSRLVYLRLRKRGAIIVPTIIWQELQSINQKLQKIQKQTDSDEMKQLIYKISDAIDRINIGVR
jgi:hypothetical protein